MRSPRRHDDRLHLLAGITGVPLVERVPYGDAVINAVDRVHAVVDGDIANMVLGKGFFQQDAYHQPIPAQAGVVFLCQVGTKKILRIYKPFIGGQPPVNGLRFSMLFCRSLCDVSYTPLQTPPSSE